MNTDTKEVSIDVPENAVIRCPMEDYDLVPVARCTVCTYFEGFLERIVSDAPFEQKYLNRCSCEPIKREMFRLVNGSG